MTIQLEEGYQTNLGNVLLPIRQQVEELNWLVTGLQCWRSGEESPLIAEWEAERRYSVVPGKTLYEVFAGRDMQVVWGVFCGVRGTVPKIPTNEIPFADGNSALWTEPEAFLMAASEIEIVAFDSSLTLIKCRDEELGRYFLSRFPDGQLLRKPIT